MTYYPDLSPYCYPGLAPSPPSIWYESYVGPPEPPVLNVGWLDGEKPYAKGPTSTEFQDRLQRLCAPDQWVEMTLGYHQCPFCDAYPARERIGGKLVSLGCAEVRVRGPAAKYATAGAYGRVPVQNHDAKYAYNHVVNPQLLMWLIRAAGVSQDLVAEARAAHDAGTTVMQQSGAIRRIVPWSVVYEVLFARRRR